MTAESLSALSVCSEANSASPPELETVIFLGSKINADGDCSHGIKRRLLLGRKAMRNLDSVLKGRDITVLTKVRLVKAMVFPVVTYRCENWTIKKAENQRFDAFGLWCWRRLLRVPWTARRSYQSTLKEISPEYSLEGLMLKLKFQTFGHLMEKTLMLGKMKAKEKGVAEDEMEKSHHRLNGYEFEQTLSDSEGQRSLACCSLWGCKVSDTT